MTLFVNQLDNTPTHQGRSINTAHEVTVIRFRINKVNSVIVSKSGFKNIAKNGSMSITYIEQENINKGEQSFLEKLITRNIQS